MSKESTYIINVTDQLSPGLREKFSKVGKDLTAIKAQSKNIRSIVLRGGGAVDILMDLVPSDFDLFYSYEESGEVITNECRCDEVREAVGRAKLIYFDKDQIDLENSYEKEPRAEPLERTCDLISFHTDYLSIFVVDEKGDVWTNTQAWEYFQKKIYEIRYEGLIPWAYFPSENDVYNYYSTFSRSIVRGIGYMAKRNLKAGDNFKILLEHTPYYFEKTLELTDPERLKSLAKSKIGSYVVAERVIDKTDIANKEEVKACFKSIF